MNIEYTDKGKLSIDVSALFYDMEDEQKIRFADTLSVEDAIIKNVAQQIINGMTDSCSYGACDDDKANPSWPLALAIREVSKGANDIAKRQIERLENALKHQEAYHRKVSDWAWSMWHKSQDMGLKPDWLEYNDVHKYGDIELIYNDTKETKKEQK